MARLGKFDRMSRRYQRIQLMPSKERSITQSYRFPRTQHSRTHSHCGKFAIASAFAILRDRYDINFAERERESVFRLGEHFSFGILQVPLNPLPPLALCFPSLLCRSEIKVL